MANSRNRSQTVATRPPGQVRLDQGTLVLKPARLADQSPSMSPGTFMGLFALRANTPVGPVAVFVHDLSVDDLRSILAWSRLQAEAQLGRNYDANPFWWEAT